MDKKSLTSGIILIDDDELIHLSWKHAASKKQIEIFCYESVERFIEDHSRFTHDSKIYVDSNLSDKLRGEDEAEKIYKLGFKNIILATGYAPSDVNLDGKNWISDIVSKRPPF